MGVHETAIIDSRAQIGTNNEIGPRVVIEGPVQIGNDNIIESGTIIKSKTIIGNNNHIHCYALIGHDPQDVTFKGGETRTIIGNGNTIREFVTVHRATREEGATSLGDNNYLMVSSHIAHDVTIGNGNYLVNQVLIAGHSVVGDHVFISTLTGIHQFARIGSYVMIGALTKIIKDIPPFMIVNGNPALVRGINVVGLKRNGFSPERRALLKMAYVKLYRSRASVKSSLTELRRMVEETDNLEIKHDLQILITFIETSKRGITLKSPLQDDDNEEEP
jgi:UDP-N-acetylglucosamine acyltransferase